MTAVMEEAALLLDEVAGIVAASEQDTSWTARWATADEITAELRGHARRLRRGDRSALDALRLLFLPTGPLQEVAISSGWGGMFLDVAERFDRALRMAHDDYR